MSDRLTSARDLRAGDVCIVAVQLKDKTTGQPFWWKRFVAVLKPMKRHAEMLTLKMHIDPDKDVRLVDFDQDVVTKVEEDAWPQGVLAMRMKWITLGVIKLGDEV
jgi:hypothetical protein